MKKFTLIAPVAALFVATAAFAQTASTDAKVGQEWKDTIKTGLFTDSTMSTLKSETDVRAAWTNLSQEDKDMVLKECATVKAETGASGTTATTGTAGSTDTATTGSTTTTTTTTDTTATGTAAADMAGVGHTTLVDLCKIVDTQG